MTTPSPPVITMSWQPELADFHQAFREINRARGLRRKLVLLTGAAVLTAGLCWLADLPGAAVGALAVPVGILLLIPVLQPLSVWMLWRRNAMLRDPVTATVDPVHGITLVTATTGGYPWAATRGLLESERVFVVQLAGVRLGFMLLAKRALASPTDVDELGALLRTHVPA